MSAAEETQGATDAAPEKEEQGLLNADTESTPDQEELSGAAAEPQNSPELEDRKEDASAVVDMGDASNQAKKSTQVAPAAGGSVKGDAGATDITDSLKGVDEGSLAGSIDKIVNNNGVVVFSKTWCPFSTELKRTLNEMGVAYSLIEVDLLEQGSAVWDYLNGKYEYPKTAPQIIVDQKHYGGCDDFKGLHTQGKALPIVRMYVAGQGQSNSIDQLQRSFYQSAEPAKGNRAMNCLFAFPPYVNGWVIQGVGIQVTIICLFGLLFGGFWKQERSMQFIIFGLFIDYCCRFVGGASFSPLGLNASIVTATWEPRISPGPPKQFAAFCGIMFSGLSALSYRLGQPYIGSAILAILMICAGMEGFLDFCVGCYFFGLGGQLGLVSKAVYKVYTNTRAETVRTWFEAFGQKVGTTYGSGKARADPNIDRPTDLDYKTKTDEQKQEDFHLIRHMRLSMFDLVLGINGTGLLLWFLSETPRPFGKVSHVFWQMFALLGVILYLVFLMMYIIKAVQYPSKVFKEWTNSLSVNSGASIFINLLLIAFFISVYNDEVGSKVSDRRFAQFLWWLASCSLMIMTVWVFGTWLQRPLSIEWIDFSWMMPGLGNLVSCIVAPYVPPAYGLRDAIWFWFAVGVFSYGILMPVTFYRSVVQPTADDRRRNGIMLWIAAPAAIVLAHRGVLAVNEDPSVIKFSQAELILYFISLFMVLVVGWSMITMHIGRAKFSESYYSYVFPMALIATCSLQYIVQDGRTDKDGIGNDFTRVIMCYPLIGATVWFCCVNLQWTVIGVLRKTLFRPIIPKWGVLSFMRLTHYAFWNWMDLYGLKLDELDGYLSNKGNDRVSDEARSLLAEMIADWNVMRMIHEEHSRHEDSVIFPEAKLVFPEFSKHADDEHHEQEELFESFADRFDACMGDGCTPAVIQSLTKDIRAFLKAFEDHLKWEEDNMQPVLRKYTSNGVQIDILRRVWLATPYERWNVFIPWVLRNQYKHMQRVLWIKTLCWAMPERCQTIGLLAYRGVSDSIWARLTREVPEIIPRGLAGWRRQL